MAGVVCDKLNTHVSEGVVRLVARLCGAYRPAQWAPVWNNAMIPPGGRSKPGGGKRDGCGAVGS